MKSLPKFVVWCEVCGYKSQPSVNERRVFEVGFAHKLGNHGVKL